MLDEEKEKVCDINYSSSSAEVLTTTKQVPAIQLLSIASCILIHLLLLSSLSPSFLLLYFYLSFPPSISVLLFSPSLPLYFSSLPPSISIYLLSLPPSLYFSSLPPSIFIYLLSLPPSLFIFSPSLRLSIYLLSLLPPSTSPKRSLKK